MRKARTGLFILLVSILMLLPVQVCAMTVVLRMTTGEVFQLAVESTDTVAAVKDQIQALIHVAPEQLALSYCGKAMKDDNELLYYGIKQGDGIMGAYTRAQATAPQPIAAVSVTTIGKDEVAARTARHYGSEAEGYSVPKTGDPSALLPVLLLLCLCVAGIRRLHKKGVIPS